MKWSLYLGKIAGIKLFIHWSFIILIGWISIMNFQMGNGFLEAILGVGFILMIFICVVLHELGHALTAKRFNIITKNITLLPIGGLANMERLPEKPGQELQVAIAGPLVNMVIATVLYLYLNITNSIPTIEELIAIQESQQPMIGGEYFLFNLMVVNVILCLFNLIPAFPMDGGRVLRAILSYRFDRAKATNIAARIGQFLAILFVFIGFYVNFWLIFIGIFIFLGAGGEAIHEATKSILSGYKVRDVLMTKYTTLSPKDNLAKAVRILLDSQDKEFLVTNGDTVVGILTSDALIKGLSEFGKEALVSNTMQKDFLVLHPEMELKETYQKMMLNNYLVGPVYDGDQLVGIVDRENINELVLVSQALAINHKAPSIK